MNQLFSGIEHDPDSMLDALILTSKHNDISQVPVIIQLMRFGLFDDFPNKAGDVLEQLTGQSYGGSSSSWDQWMLWFGEHVDEFPPPSGYPQWKVDLLSIIHPRFEDLMAMATTSRISLVEVVWGGVSPDGIRDLRFSPVVSIAEEDYLEERDRVFGVSINGEHRAYPVRILNVHEMANDIVGGEPIALTY